MQLVVAVVAVVEFESSAGGDSFKYQLRLPYKDLVISGYLRKVKGDSNIPLELLAPALALDVSLQDLECENGGDLR